MPVPEINAENARLFNLANLQRQREQLEANVELFERHLKEEKHKLDLCNDAIEVLESGDGSTH